MTHRVRGLSFRQVAGTSEWHLLRGEQVVATISAPVISGPYEAVYLGEVRPFLRLGAAKDWLRRAVASAVKRYGSLEQADAQHQREMVAVVRRLVLVGGTFGAFSGDIATIVQKPR